MGEGVGINHPLPIVLLGVSVAVVDPPLPLPLRGTDNNSITAVSVREFFVHPFCTGYSKGIYSTRVLVVSQVPNTSKLRICHYCCICHPPQRAASRNLPLIIVTHSRKEESQKREPIGLSTVDYFTAAIAYWAAVASTLITHKYSPKAVENQKGSELSTVDYCTTWYSSSLLDYSRFHVDRP